MNDKILAITAPDDDLRDGSRYLLVDLNEDQMAIISQALNQIGSFSNLILYMWKPGEDYTWLLDKKLKSDVIIFNADSHDHTLVGYLAAQPNACYFGTLKNIGDANKNAIYEVAQIVDILEKTLTQ